MGICSGTNSGAMGVSGSRKPGTKVVAKNCSSWKTKLGMLVEVAGVVESRKKASTRSGEDAITFQFSLD